MDSKYYLKYNYLCAMQSLVLSRKNNMRMMENGNIIFTFYIPYPNHLTSYVHFTDPTIYGNKGDEDETSGSMESAVSKDTV